MNTQRNDAERRREQAYERLGTRTPRCRHCNENDPVALTGRHPDIVCYQCKAVCDGKPPTEDHHVGGKGNHPFKVPIPANDHRRLNDMQNDHPDRTRQNPDGSPLLALAAVLRGWIDILHQIIEGLVGRIPTALENLDARLTAFIGLDWWITIGWQGVQ